MTVIVASDCSLRSWYYVNLIFDFICLLSINYCVVGMVLVAFTWIKYACIKMNFIMCT